MKNLLVPNQRKLSRPYYLQHPELKGQVFAGPHDTSSRGEVLALVRKNPAWPSAPNQVNRTLEGVSWALDWLLTFRGEGWRDRWVASGADTNPLGWLTERRQGDRRMQKTIRVIAIGGMRTLIVSRVVLPGYAFFSNWKTSGYRLIIAQQDATLLTRMQAFALQTESSENEKANAWRMLAKMLLHTGKDLPELSAEDIFELRAHNQVGPTSGTPALGLVWGMLSSVGIFPAESTLRGALRLGQQKPDEMVDRYGISPGPVRDLLVRYLEERKTSVDYTTIKSNARMLVGNFWADLEYHNPELVGADSIALPKAMVSAWKERLSVIVTRDGLLRPRSEFLDILLTVRCFYLDLRDWALNDPSLVRWVVASPITSADVASNAKRKLSHQARIHQRIRERVPLLPRILARLEHERREAQQMLQLAEQATADANFTFDGRTYQLIDANLRISSGLPPKQAHNVVCTETGEELSIGRIEEDAFWLWAVVETLRHSGLRIEELLELTHLALVSLRYDHYEALTGPRLPHLFQRNYGAGPSVLCPTLIRRSLRALAERMQLTDAAGNSIYLTPHDFRRVFTTTAIQDGLPLHIASKILGHRHLNSTQPYTAVFQDDLIRTYRAFVDRRRTARPVEEYRDPTPDEWDEFEEHFTLRRVELGSCARPYGSNCEHEHACIRCPVLRVDPTQLDRLEAIAASLKERIAEADERGWAGEVEQLKISLQAARDKILATAPPRDGSVFLNTPSARTR